MVSLENLGSTIPVNFTMLQIIARDIYDHYRLGCEMCSIAIRSWLREVILIAHLQALKDR